MLSEVGDEFANQKVRVFVLESRCCLVVLKDTNQEKLKWQVSVEYKGSSVSCMSGEVNLRIGQVRFLHTGRIGFKSTATFASTSSLQSYLIKAHITAQQDAFPLHPHRCRQRYEHRARSTHRSTRKSSRPLHSPTNTDISPSSSPAYPPPAQLALNSTPSQSARPAA